MQEAQKIWIQSLGWEGGTEQGLDPFKETSGVTPVQGIHPDGPVSEKGPSHSSDRFSGSFSVLSFCLFILFMGFSRQEY